MIPYASQTSGHNMRLLRDEGWRFMISATGHWGTHGFRYALDNGAWHAFRNGKPWDERLFLELVDKLGSGADWIVAPDIVEGGLESLDRSLSWRDRLPGLVLLAVQDGMTTDHLKPHVSRETGIFVGGSTEWKESTLPQWGALSRETGCYLHVGRVNSQRRITLCKLVGANSFDGSCLSIYGKKKLTVLRKALHQRTLPLYVE